MILLSLQMKQFTGVSLKVVYQNMGRWCDCSKAIKNYCFREL